MKDFFERVSELDQRYLDIFFQELIPISTRNRIKILEANNLIAEYSNILEQKFDKFSNKQLLACIISLTLDIVSTSELNCTQHQEEPGQTINYEEMSDTEFLNRLAALLNLDTSISKSKVVDAPVEYVDEILKIEHQQMLDRIYKKYIKSETPKEEVQDNTYDPDGWIRKQLEELN